MHSELTKTVDGINAVRRRAAASIRGGADMAEVGTYSDEALRNERRYELAFEGLRYGDIRRWGIAADALNEIYNVPIRNRGIATTMKPQGVGVKARYQATNGFFNKPNTELEKAKDALQQNPGWTTNDAAFNAWTE